MAQFTGVVRWFSNAKGFGFLGREGGSDVFCHFTSIQIDGYKRLSEGEEVEFDVIQGHQGLQAENVTPTKKKQKPAGLSDTQDAKEEVNVELPQTSHS